MVFRSFLIWMMVASAEAAPPCHNITHAMIDLYPHHTEEMMALRFKNASNKHKFLRSFIPYYYQAVHLSADQLPAFKKAKSTTGYIVGDAHVENFGYLISNEGKSVLALNDFDDVAQAPLVLDVMRLTQSASYMDKELDIAKVIKAYMKGLKDAPYELSEYLVKRGAKSQAGGSATKADFSVVNGRKVFSVKQMPTINPTEKQKAEILKLIQKKFGPKATVSDSYLTMKESGGSAFGSRAHLLVDFDGQTHFIELKEVMDTGVVPKLMSVKMTNTDRILKSRNVFLGDNFDKKLDVVDFDHKKFQLRFRDEGNKSIDFSALKKKEIPQVIKDEFFILGQLHRKSLNNAPAQVDQYVTDLNTISIKDWGETNKILKDKVKIAFDKANGK